MAFQRLQAFVAQANREITLDPEEWDTNNYRAKIMARFWDAQILDIRKECGFEEAIILAKLEKDASKAWIERNRNIKQTYGPGGGTPKQPGNKAPQNNISSMEEHPLFADGIRNAETRATEKQIYSYNRLRRH